MPYKLATVYAGRAGQPEILLPMRIISNEYGDLYGQTNPSNPTIFKTHEDAARIAAELSKIRNYEIRVIEIADKSIVE